MLASQVKLRRLQRRAEELAVQVLLVARDGLTVNLARRIGIRTFLFKFEALWVLRQHQGRERAEADAAGMLAAGEGPSAPPKARHIRRRRIPGDRFRLRTLPSRGRILSIFMGLLVVAALGAGLFYTILSVVPVATVEVVPSVMKVSETVLVTADPQAAEVDLAGRIVPARLVEVQLEGSAQIATTSKKPAPDKRATGVITFANRTAQDVRVPAGTVVRTSTGTNIRFNTTKEVVVPAGIGNRADAEITAVTPGPSGNVGAFLISTIEGGVGLAVTAVNGQPTSGGDVKQVGVVTAADREHVKDVLLQELRQEAYVRIQEQLDAQEFVPPQTVEIAIISELYDKFLDELSDSLGIKMRVVANAVAVAGQDANTVALAALQASVPPDHTLVAPGLTFERGEVRIGDRRRVNFAMTASGAAVANIDTSGLRESLTGQSIERAQAIVMERLPLKQPPAIQVRPDWSGRMPQLPFRINVWVQTELE